MKLTIFTPSYNRAYILPNLFQSLQRQTCKDFEWLIVDDGSSDDTEHVVKSWLGENSIEIRYIKQANGGKHRAINTGVQYARGELFFIVDSDDYLTDDAVEKILFYYDEVRNNETFGGICGMRAFSNGNRIGGELNFKIKDCSPFELRNKWHIRGDMAEIVKTKVFREYTFPSIGGEKFCPEALVWDRMSEKYKFRYFNENIYVCEYLEDGLTSSMTRIRMKSPQYAMLYYSERYHRQLCLYEKIKAAINYWRFRACYKGRVESNVVGWGVLLKPIGIIYHLIDLQKQ